MKFVIRGSGVQIPPPAPKSLLSSPETSTGAAAGDRYDFVVESVMRLGKALIGLREEV
jgi:hypothetical protein